LCNVGIGNDGGQGDAIISDTGSTVTVSANLQVGRIGQGTLTVENGAAVNASAGTWFGIGVTPGSHGQVTVTGAGATLDAPGFTAVGAQGNGHLGIHDGGQATLGAVGIGNDDGGQGEVIVSDPGSSLSVTGTDFQVGSNGNGTLTVQNGGGVVAHGLQIGARTGTGTFNLTGGTLDNNGGTVFVGANGTLNAASGTIKNVGEILDDSGQPIPLVKATLGTLVMAGVNSYSGGTDVEAGTLQFDGAAALPPGSNVTAGPSGVVVFSSGYTGPISAVADAPAPVPEPGTLLLLTAGSAAWMLWRRRNRIGGKPNRPDRLEHVGLRRGRLASLAQRAEDCPYLSGD
jgi:T5SS/PEP-CTERM-associated repeat protein/autotransporter-associated beta strand protein